MPHTPVVWAGFVSVLLSVSCGHLKACSFCAGRWLGAWVPLRNCQQRAPVCGLLGLQLGCRVITQKRKGWGETGRENRLVLHPFYNPALGVTQHHFCHILCCLTGAVTSCVSVCVCTGSHTQQSPPWSKSCLFRKDFLYGVLRFSGKFIIRGAPRSKHHEPCRGGCSPLPLSPALSWEPSLSPAGILPQPGQAGKGVGSFALYPESCQFDYCCFSLGHGLLGQKPWFGMTWLWQQWKLSTQL